MCYSFWYNAPTMLPAGGRHEIYLLIKYIKSVLWRVAKRLSYIEEARCLKVNDNNGSTFASPSALHAQLKGPALVPCLLTLCSAPRSLTQSVVTVVLKPHTTAQPQLIRSTSPQLPCPDTNKRRPHLSPYSRPCIQHLVLR